MASANRVLAFSPAPPPASKPTLVQADEASQLLLGPSPAVTQLWAQIRRISPYFRTTLLTGEKGTGAHAVARALHDLSPGCRDSFVPLSPTDAEEAFAHGRFEPGPQQGTYFLANIESLSRAGQSGLLRLLRRRGQHPVRVIAFSEHGLRSAISTGCFSNDVASALSAVRIALPALRDRAGDIPLLAHHLLRSRTEAQGRPVPSLTPSFLDAACRYPWPGNLEQMASVLDWLLEWAAGATLDASSLEAAISARTSSHQTQPTRMVKLNQVVQEHIRAVLLGCNGNKLRAAEVLGISRSTLYRMLEETGHAATVFHPN